MTDQTQTQAPSDTVVARFALALRSQEKSSRMDMDKWAARFAQDPAYALEWADATFTSTATWKVANMLLGIIDRADPSAEKVASIIRDQLRHARSVPSSTSHTSNLLEANVTGAWIRMDELFESCAAG